MRDKSTCGRGYRGAGKSLTRPTSTSVAVDFFLPGRTKVEHASTS